MTTVIPSTLNQSAVGTTRSQSKIIIGQAQRGDMIFYSGVSFFGFIGDDSSAWADLANIFDAKIKAGVYCFMFLPWLWENANFPISPSGQGYLNMWKSYPNFFHLGVDWDFISHEKMCGWISLDNTASLLGVDNVNSAIYFGSSNFYNSWHDEIGCYIIGNFYENDLSLQSVMVRYANVSDFGYSAHDNRSYSYGGMGTNFTPDQWTQFNLIKQKFLTKITWSKNNLNPQLNKASGYLGVYPIPSGTQFKLDYNETALCLQAVNNPGVEGWDKPIANDLDSQLTKPRPLTGGFRIALAPKYHDWSGMFAPKFPGNKDNGILSLVQALFSGAQKYIKVSIMELDLSDFSINKDGDFVANTMLGSIIDAIRRGVHIQFLMNTQWNWNAKHMEALQLNFSNLYNGVRDALKDEKVTGTYQIRYSKGNLHTKMYVSDKDVILTSQHPTWSFYYYVMGSAILFNDPNLRLFYDNFFNMMWVNSWNYNSPVNAISYATYPLSPGTTDYAANNPYNDGWFAKSGNLVMCNDQDGDPFFSTCCTYNNPTKDLTPLVKYEVIFSDANLLNNLDKSTEAPDKYYFYSWWYNQIKNTPPNGFIYIICPVVWLGIDQKNNLGEGKKLEYDEGLNQYFGNAYKSALDNGVNFYMTNLWSSSFQWGGAIFRDQFLDDYPDQIHFIDSSIFLHEKIFATPNAAYTGSQNALLPDSYEAGFAFYSDSGEGTFNPLYYEVIKRAQQFVNINAGYKALKYDISNPLKCDWVNAVNGNTATDVTSFIAISPGNSDGGIGYNKFGNNKFASTMMGDKVTTETEAIINVIKNANEFLYIAAWDMGVNEYWSPDSKAWWTLWSEVFEKSKSVQVTCIVSRQGSSARIGENKFKVGDLYKRMIEWNNAGTGKINLYIVDPYCPKGNENPEYWLNRKCHPIHAKFFLSENSVYNTSSNLDPSYLEEQTRNSGVYVKNNSLVLTQFKNLCDFIISRTDCITLSRDFNTIGKCIDETPLDDTEQPFFEPYKDMPNSNPKSAPKSTYVTPPFSNPIYVTPPFSNPIYVTPPFSEPVIPGKFPSSESKSMDWKKIGIIILLVILIAVIIGFIIYLISSSSSTPRKKHRRRKR